MEQIFMMMVCITINGQSVGCRFPPPRHVFTSLDTCKNFIRHDNFPTKEGDITYTTGCVTKSISVWKPAQ